MLPESKQKAVVESYIEGFRRSDHAAILSCLTDDVVWEIHGHASLRGKVAFDAEIENDAFPGPPILSLGRLVEEGDTVVAVGGGSSQPGPGEVMRFLFADVFTFDGDLINRVESYLVPLT